jgi:hypothetical protein
MRGGCNRKGVEPEFMISVGYGTNVDGFLDVGRIVALPQHVNSNNTSYLFLATR